jgi:hypothetical protein
MSVRDTASNLQDTILDTLKTSQDAVLTAIRTAADTAEPVTGLIPDTFYAERLPVVTEVVESAFSFAEKVLANQKLFVAQLLQAVAPAPEHKPSVKPAAKATKAA